MLKILMLLIGVNVFAIDNSAFKADVNVLAPSIIIGPGPDWIQADTLNHEAPEYKLSQMMGQLYSSRHTKCSAWVHPVNGEVYTANHCFNPNHKWARFVWLGEEYILDKWLCNSTADVCRTIDFEAKAKIKIKLPLIIQQGLLIHRQKNKTVISYGTFKDHPIAGLFIHYMDSAPGSSGGMLVVRDGKSLLPVAVHHSGSKDKQENYGSALEYLVK